MWFILALIAFAVSFVGVAYFSWKATPVIGVGVFLLLLAAADLILH